MAGMNNLLQMIMQTQNGGAAQQAGAQLGLNSQQTQSALGALMPAITSALKQNTQSPQGFAQLMSALQNGNHEQYIDKPEAVASPEATLDGNAILGHLFGSKDVSRQVAGAAANQTGLDVGILKKFLPLAATLAMGGLARQTRQPSIKNQLAGLALGKMLGGNKSGGLGAMIGSMVGGNKVKQQHQQGLGLLGGLLDSDGDGNIMDDLLQKAMNIQR